MNTQLLPDGAYAVTYTPESMMEVVLRTLNANKDINGLFRIQGIFRASNKGIVNESYVYATLDGKTVGTSIRLFFSSKYNGIAMYEQLKSGKQYIFVGTLELYSYKDQFFLQMRPQQVLNVDGSDSLPETDNDALDLDTLTGLYIQKCSRNHHIPAIVEKKIRQRTKVRLAVVCPKSGTAEVDFVDGIKGLRKDFFMELYSCNFTEPDLMVKRLQEADASDADLVLFIRGGGENLEVTDDKAILEQVVAMQKPVITGLGHEVDKLKVETLADKRCSTPHGAGSYLNELRESVSEIISREKEQDEKVRILERELATARKHVPEPLFYGIKGTDNKYVKIVLFILLAAGVLRILSFFA